MSSQRAASVTDLTSTMFGIPSIQDRSRRPLTTPILRGTPSPMKKQGRMRSPLLMTGCRSSDLCLSSASRKEEWVHYSRPNPRSRSKGSQESSMMLVSHSRESEMGQSKSLSRSFRQLLRPKPRLKPKLSLNLNSRRRSIRQLWSKSLTLKCQRSDTLNNSTENSFLFDCDVWRFYIYTMLSL